MVNVYGALPPLMVQLSSARVLAVHSSLVLANASVSGSGRTSNAVVTTTAPGIGLLLPGRVIAARR